MPQSAAQAAVTCPVFSGLISWCQGASDKCDLCVKAREAAATWAELQPLLRAEEAEKELERAAAMEEADKEQLAAKQRAETAAKKKAAAQAKEAAGKKAAVVKRNL